jgi:hypothetical protein
MPHFRPIFAALLAVAGLRADESQALLRAAAESNVNQRYTIEAVSISGSMVERLRVPPGLRGRLQSLVGAHYDVSEVDELAAQLKRDLHLKDVVGRVSRGSSPDQVRVNFEAVRRNAAFDISVPRFLYHSSQGWSGEVDAAVRIRQNRSLTLGVISNGNDFVERATGLSLRAEDSSLAGGRIHLAVTGEAFHSQWNAMTLAALRTENRESELYRARRNVASLVSMEVARPLTVSFGASLQQMESWTGLPLRSANALTGDIRYRRSGEQSALQGEYSVRLGTRALGSDYAYSRHVLTARYEFKSGRQTAADEFTAGAITGNAPLFERFVLGSNSTLRGWDRYNIDPTGGSHMAHNSATWSYQTGEGAVEAFYDAGTLWREGKPAQLRHSVGAGYRQGNFTFCVAFPVMEGRMTPVFMAGMNY